MKKTFKYRLLGNKQTFAKADEWLILCQRLYNVCLEQRIYIYRQSKETISGYDQSSQLPEMKAAFPEYRNVGSQVLQEVIKVPRFEPTSKICSQCGAINQELKLSDRQWVCKACGVLHDRDYNAAKNICRVGQTLQESTYGSSQCVS